MLRAAGVDVVVEHGVVTGEVEGLEIARVLVDDDDVATLEIGVGRHDREAFAVMHADRPTGRRRWSRWRRPCAATVRPGPSRIRSTASPPSRRLRSFLIDQPELVGRGRPGAGAPGPAPRRPAGRRARGRRRLDGRTAAPVVVVASVGIDLDLVPEAADVRADPSARARCCVSSCPSGTCTPGSANRRSCWPTRPRSSRCPTTGSLRPPDRRPTGDRGRSVPCTVVAGLLERMGDFEREFADVEARLADPAIIADQPRYVAEARRYKELEAVVAVGRRLAARMDDLEVGPGADGRRSRRRTRRVASGDRPGPRPTSPPSRTSCGCCCCPVTPTTTRT